MVNWKLIKYVLKMLILIKLRILYYYAVIIMCQTNYLNLDLFNVYRW